MIDHFFIGASLYSQVFCDKGALSEREGSKLDKNGDQSAKAHATVLLIGV